MNLEDQKIQGILPLLVIGEYNGELEDLYELHTVSLISQDNIEYNFYDDYKIYSESLGCRACSKSVAEDIGYLLSNGYIEINLENNVISKTKISSINLAERGKSIYHVFPKLNDGNKSLSETIRVTVEEFRESNVSTIGERLYSISRKEEYCRDLTDAELKDVANRDYTLIIV